MYTQLLSDVDSGGGITQLEDAEVTLEETRILSSMLLPRVGASTLLIKSKVISTCIFDVLNILKSPQIRRLVFGKCIRCESMFLINTDSMSNLSAAVALGGR